MIKKNKKEVQLIYIALSIIHELIHKLMVYDQMPAEIIVVTQV